LKHKHIISAIFLFLITNISFAQNSETKRFGAYLIQEPTKEVVQFGAIKNIKTGEVTLTDTEGFFAISGSVGDTLRFHSLGYRDTTWVIPGIWYTTNQKLELKVQTNVYALSEVEVVRYYSYAHFKQAFKDLRLPEDEKDKAKQKISSWAFDDAIAWGKSDAVAARGTFGVGISFGGKDKVVTQRKEVGKLEEIQNKSQRFNYFTSRENVMQLTQYKGTCLDSFMVFLNTGYNLNYQMPEYNLLASILEAASNFKKLKGDEEWFLDFENGNNH